MAVEQCDHGLLSREELERLFLFINNPSAGFLIGAVGSGLFGSTAAGVALLCTVQLSALTVGLLLRPHRSGKIAPETRFNPPHMPTAADLIDSVKRGFSTLLTVVAFVLFASAVVTCLESMPLLQHAPTWLRVLLCGTVELTAGVAAAAGQLPPSTAFCLCAFLAGFSGLSVCLQLFSVAEGRGLSLWRYLAAKLLQGALSAGGAWLSLRLFHPALRVSADAVLPTLADGNAATRLLAPPLAAVLLLLCCGVVRCKKAGIC
jgi:uncharacterized membrane protein YoaK (UPF0700 family)